MFGAPLTLQVQLLNTLDKHIAIYVANEGAGKTLFSYKLDKSLAPNIKGLCKWGPMFREPGTKCLRCVCIAHRSEGRRDRCQQRHA